MYLYYSNGLIVPVPVDARSKAYEYVYGRSPTTIVGSTDTILHRIVQCREGAIIWDWTKTRIAAILRVHQSVIPEEWTIRPVYKFWPANRQTAISWILAHLTFKRRNVICFI
jgi:hypothetical protein